MNTKLTLSLDSTVIESAKENLQTKEKSLSSIIEDYFKVLLLTKRKEPKVTPIVKELLGIAHLPKTKSKKDTITDYLLEKYK